MNKKEAVRLVADLRDNRVPDGTLDERDAMMEPLCGLGCSDFERGKIVSHDAALCFLRYQCCQMNGRLDEAGLSYILGLMKEKQVMIV